MLFYTTESISLQLPQGGGAGVNFLHRQVIERTSPGYPHANVVRQGDDGGHSCGKLHLRPDKSIITIHITGHQSDNDERQQV